MNRAAAANQIAGDGDSLPLPAGFAAVRERIGKTGRTALFFATKAR